MTLTLILVASVTINIILLLLVNYISKKRAEIMLGIWKFKEEKKIRNDAHARSRAVGWGKTIEKFVPWMKGFPCDPRDSIFLAKKFCGSLLLLEKNCLPLDDERPLLVS